MLHYLWNLNPHFHHLPKNPLACSVNCKMVQYQSAERNITLPRETLFYKTKNIKLIVALDENLREQQHFLRTKFYDKQSKNCTDIIVWSNWLTNWPETEEGLHTSAPFLKIFIEITKKTKKSDISSYTVFFRLYKQYKVAILNRPRPNDHMTCKMPPRGGDIDSLLLKRGLYWIYTLDTLTPKGGISPSGVAASKMPWPKHIRQNRWCACGDGGCVRNRVR